jgi:type IV secretory pathway VirB2 component (pilin)
MPSLDAPPVIEAAVDWFHMTLLGTIATTTAILAIAFVGLLMLTGRIDVRRAAQVVVGCFIIFGASTIANGILAALNGRGAASPEIAAAPLPPPVLAQPSAYSKANTPYDPYAGAALPPR